MINENFFSNVNSLLITNAELYKLAELTGLGLSLSNVDLNCMSNDSKLKIFVYYSRFLIK